MQSHLRIIRMNPEYLVGTKTDHLPKVFVLRDAFSQNTCVVLCKKLVWTDESEQPIRGEETQALFYEDHIDVIVALCGRPIIGLVKLAFLGLPLLKLLHPDIRRIADNTVKTLLFFEDASEPARLACPIECVYPKPNVFVALPSSILI